MVTPSSWRFLEALADPAHDDHEQLLTWVGVSSDPTAFDLLEINDCLATIKD